MSTLNNKKIAILTETGFEEVELTSPKKALEAAGAIVEIVSLQKIVTSWKDGQWGTDYRVDKDLQKANSEDYDALMIPGGVINPDKMRREKAYVYFVEEFLEAGKPIAAICHGPQLLIETGRLKNKDMTSFPSIKTDLLNAGANWMDKEVVVDNGLVTSRSPADLEAFNKKMVEEFAEGAHVVVKA